MTDYSDRLKAKQSLDADAGVPTVEIFSFASWPERAEHPGLRDAWLASEQAKPNRNWNSLPGICQLCRHNTGFRLAPGSNPSSPDLRESLLCSRCLNNSRIRAALGLLPSPIRSDGAVPKIYVTEQVTRTFIWMQRHIEGDIRGSEFQSDPDKRRKLTRQLKAAGGQGEVEFQDVTRLSFPDAALDAIVTFEVLEHVPDYRAAISEFGRTLRSGGICIATFPFTDRQDTLVRARVNEHGDIQHLLEPEYHGDPISGGVLCYYHFGWDILEEFRNAGFSDVRMVMPWSHDYGYYYGLWTLLATR